MAVLPSGDFGSDRRDNAGARSRARRNHRGGDGNRQFAQISASLFAPSATLASVIANEFAEATPDMYLSSLVELGLVLLAVGLALNVWRERWCWAPRSAGSRATCDGGKPAVRTRRTRWRKAKSDLMMG